MFEVGRKYETKSNGEFECIAVTEPHAWMRSDKTATGYVWTQDGKSVSLNQDWDITPKPREYWIYRDLGFDWSVTLCKPTAQWDEVIHVREVLE